MLRSLLAVGFIMAIPALRSETASAQSSEPEARVGARSARVKHIPQPEEKKRSFYRTFILTAPPITFGLPKVKERKRRERNEDKFKPYKSGAHRHKTHRRAAR